MIRYLTLAAGLAAAAGPAAAFDIDAMSEAERQAFRAEIRAYLLENPEVLMEAIAVLEDRESAELAEADARLVAAHADALFDDGVSWIGGNPDGDVTIVEFLDYRCGYCRRAAPEVAELLETDGNIRLIVKEFPILGEESLLASRFAIAVQRVAGNDAYEAVHDALMTQRGNVTEASLTRMAEAEGLDVDAVFAEMEDPEVAALIHENRALGQSLGISGTPTFVIGKTLVRGYIPLASMEKVVEDVREGS